MTWRQCGQPSGKGKGPSETPRLSSLAVLLVLVFAAGHAADGSRPPADWLQSLTTVSADGSSLGTVGSTHPELQQQAAAQQDSDAAVAAAAAAGADQTIADITDWPDDIALPKRPLEEVGGGGPAGDDTISLVELQGLGAGPGVGDGLTDWPDDMTSPKGGTGGLPGQVSAAVEEETAFAAASAAGVEPGSGRAVARALPEQPLGGVQFIGDVGLPSVASSASSSSSAVGVDASTEATSAAGADSVTGPIPDITDWPDDLALPKRSFPGGIGPGLLGTLGDAFHPDYEDWPDDMLNPKPDFHHVLHKGDQQPQQSIRPTEDVGADTAAAAATAAAGAAGAAGSSAGGDSSGGLVPDLAALPQQQQQQQQQVDYEDWPDDVLNPKPDFHMLHRGGMHSDGNSGGTIPAAAVGAAADASDAAAGAAATAAAEGAIAAAGAGSSAAVAEATAAKSAAAEAAAAAGSAGGGAGGCGKLVWFMAYHEPAPQQQQGKRVGSKHVVVPDRDEESYVRVALASAAERAPSVLPVVVLVGLDEASERSQQLVAALQSAGARVLHWELRFIEHLRAAVAQGQRPYGWLARRSGFLLLDLPSVFEQVLEAMGPSAQGVDRGRFLYTEPGVMFTGDVSPCTTPDLGEGQVYAQAGGADPSQPGSTGVLLVSAARLQSLWPPLVHYGARHGWAFRGQVHGLLSSYAAESSSSSSSGGGIPATLLPPELNFKGFWPPSAMPSAANSALGSSSAADGAGGVLAGCRLVHFLGPKPDRCLPCLLANAAKRSGGDGACSWEQHKCAPPFKSLFSKAAEQDGAALYRALTDDWQRYRSAIRPLGSTADTGTAAAAAAAKRRPMHKRMYTKRKARSTA